MQTRKWIVLDMDSWQASFDEYSKLDLSVYHRADDHRINLPDEEDVNEVLVSMGKLTKKDQLNCGACGYETCIEHAAAVKKGLAEIEMCLPVYH